jgi:hypothetical protein
VLRGSCCRCPDPDECGPFLGVGGGHDGWRSGGCS